MSQIGRFDVWQSVFGKEPEAYRELCIKEWYNTFFEAKKDTNDELLILKYEMGVMRLIQLEEWNTPFTVDDGIKIIIDCFGKDVLPKIIIEAEKNVKQREEIVKPYVKQDDQWVGYAKNVLNKLKQYNIE
jgi:archaeosine-15-forming tRNA-guanine transglycosylase